MLPDDLKNMAKVSNAKTNLSSRSEVKLHDKSRHGHSFRYELIGLNPGGCKFDKKLYLFSHSNTLILIQNCRVVYLFQ